MSEQLDLFGGSLPVHQPKEKKVVEKPVVIEVKEEIILDKNDEVKEISEFKTEEQVENIVETNIEIAPFFKEIKSVITESSQPKYETVYEAIQKRKRGRPRKVRPLNEPPKVKLKRGRKPFSEININLDLTDVPSDEELNKKQYYPISLVAKWFNVTNSQIRFWENEFDVLQPKKNGKGDRHFRPDDIRNLKIIYHLLRQRKFSIEGAKEYLKANQNHVSKDIQLKESLQNIKSFLLELKANL